MSKILISDITLPPIDTKNGLVSKDKALLAWLIEFAEKGIKEGTLKIGDLIPPKKDLAKYHGISTGTVQNAIRYAEDLGYFKSRQCVGTMVADINIKDTEKPNSKKDAAKDAIKRYIIQNRLGKGVVLPGARALAIEINSSQNTVRLALMALVQDGILKGNGKNSNKAQKTLEVDYKELKALFGEKTQHIKNETLPKKVYLKIKEYIVKNYKIGDKIISNEEFAKMFNVSVRTINAATKKLNKEKIILSMRGQYGTRYINDPEFLKAREGAEKSKFMSSTKGASSVKKNYSYNWQRVLEQIKKYMVSNHEAGDKLPSMKDLAKTFDVSSNTVRKAVSELTAQGILFCQRGKHGGIYIVEMPAKEDAFQWLALNPKFLDNN